MSADKRAVSTDALATLGTIIDESGKRDAIHLAVEPCVAGEVLYPGQHIGIQDGRATTKATKKLGIVDPFITGFVPEGMRFWLIVYPRQITSLRHVWEHPDFTDVVVVNEKSSSEQWIRDFAEQSGVQYETLISQVNSGLGLYGDEYFTIHGEDAYGSIPAEFWDHMEVVTGKKMALRPQYFSCSC